MAVPRGPGLGIVVDEEAVRMVAAIGNDWHNSPLVHRRRDGRRVVNACYARKALVSQLMQRAASSRQS